MTFKRGNTYNPHGARLPKNKLQRQVKELLVGDVDRALATIRRALNSKSMGIALEAAELVLAYVYGKPTQQVDLTGDGKLEIQISLVKSEAEHDTIEATAKKLLPDADESQS